MMNAEGCAPVSGEKAVMDRINALACARIDGLYAECAAEKPGAEAGPACRSAMVALYWTVIGVSSVADGVLLLLIGRAALGDWPVWLAIAAACLGALAVIAFTGPIRRHIERLGGPPPD